MLVVERLCGVRDAWEWLACAGVELFNAFARRHGVDKDVPHSFTFKLRRELSADEDRTVAANWERRLPGVAPHPDDVLCLIKTFMADSHLQQSPLLVLPATRCQRIPATPQVVVTHAISQERARELLVIARILEKPAYGMTRAAAYIRELAANRPVRLEQFPALPWLSARVGPRPLVDGQARPPAVLPQTPWNLQARFKRLHG